MIVVDASVAAKWFLAEPDSDRALALLERCEAELCGPDLLGVEVCRALVAAANARRIDQAAARAAITTWLDKTSSRALPLRPINARMLGRATDVAIDLGHPLGDCVYLVLAIELECDLVTCDAKFRDKAAALYPRVRLLADLS